MSLKILQDSFDTGLCTRLTAGEEESQNKEGVFLKVSTRGHYGLRAVVAIARIAQRGDLISVGELAKAEGLSSTYLEQLVGKLRRAGILKSYRGSRGGYELVKDPFGISIEEVLIATGETVCFPDCTLNKDCYHTEADGRPCPSSFFWKKVCESFRKIARETTVGSLMQEYEKETRS